MHNEIADIVDDIKLNGDEDTDIYVSAIMEVVDKSKDLDNYLARIEQAARENLQGARIIALMEWNVTEREDYWEREYIIAWVSGKECGTHRANIDSENNSMLVHGHYYAFSGDAMTDFYERIGVKD